MSVHLATTHSWCVGCWNQQVDARHVQWDVAFDGGARRNENGYPVETVDDLVLCENCVRAAVELLDISPRLLVDKEREIEALKRDLAKANQYLEGLEDLIPRRPGRPRKVAA